MYFIQMSISYVEMMFLCTLSVKLNGGRHVQGILRGFDPFMNLVVDDTIEMGPGGQMNTIGMVVRTQYHNILQNSFCKHNLLTQV